MDFDYWEHQRLDPSSSVHRIVPSSSAYQSFVRQQIVMSGPTTATSDGGRGKRKAQQQQRRATHNTTATSATIVLDDQEELESVRALIGGGTVTGEGAEYGNDGGGGGGGGGRVRYHREEDEEDEDRRTMMTVIGGRTQPKQRRQFTTVMMMRGNSNNTRIARMSSGNIGLPCSSSSSSASTYHIRDTSSACCSSTTRPSSSISGGDTVCAVCGDGHAKLHYGVLACYGCKGFFRRTLSGKYHYVCRFGNNCIVDKYQRNSCRCCRFKRCLDVGMDPKAVRPDRDLTGKQRVPRVRKRAIDEELINHMMRLQGDDWSRKIPVESKMLLMQLLNIESKVAKGECAMDALVGIDSPSQPQLPAPHPTAEHSTIGSRERKGDLSLREMFEQNPSLNARRTEMGYEPYRMAKAEELPKIAHRGAIAAVDWVESLAELIDTVLLSTQDKIALVKTCYAPLTIFNFSARTAQNTRNADILCLCSHSFVPRKLPPDFNGSNHLSNNLIDRTLNELVGPLRNLCLREEEVVPLKAIIILDPNAKHLSAEAQRGVAELRDRLQDMLYQVVKELHPVHNAASRFGNLLLLLPTITTLSGVMYENMQFCQVFGWTDPLLNELFETDSSNKDDFASVELSECLFGGAIGGASYSPPMLGGPESGGTPAAVALCNPADISLHSSPGPTSELPSSSFSSSPHSSSSSSLRSVQTMVQVRCPTTKCEMSTQTEAMNGIGTAQLGECQQPSMIQAVQHHSDPPSSTNQFDQQQLLCSSPADVLSPLSLGAFFDDADLEAMSQHHHFPAFEEDNPHPHNSHHQIMAFASADPLLFDSSSINGTDELFRLMQ